MYPSATTPSESENVAVSFPAASCNATASSAALGSVYVTAVAPLPMGSVSVSRRVLPFTAMDETAFGAPPAVVTENALLGSVPARFRP